MAIELRTGVPGHGKTLSMVQDLSKLLARWVTHPQEARPVFVHNIKELALLHLPMPVKAVSENKTGQKIVIPDWTAMPDGSLVIIDEAQDIFPARAAGSLVPDHVAWLNTHRHRGFDIWMSTQIPKFVDFQVRGLVSKHRHYRRLFGAQRSIVYEWDACSDSLSGMKNAVTTYWSFPRDTYKFYKSAEIHTKQKFKLPLWLGIPVIGVVIGIFTVPKAYSVITNGAQGNGLQTQTSNVLLTKPQFVSDAGGGGGGALAAPPPPPAPLSKEGEKEETKGSVAVTTEYTNCEVGSARSKCSCMTVVSSIGLVTNYPSTCKASPEAMSELIRLLPHKFKS